MSQNEEGESDAPQRPVNASSIITLVIEGRERFAINRIKSTKPFLTALVRHAERQQQQLRHCG